MRIQDPGGIDPHRPPPGHNRREGRNSHQETGCHDERAGIEGIGESFASPREDRSDHELERIITSIARGDRRAAIYREIVSQSGLDLSPAEAWLLGRLAYPGIAESRSDEPQRIAAP